MAQQYLADTKTPTPLPTLPKCRTGIRGFDQITMGGLPRSRATLISGGAGAGKSLLSLEFLCKGAREFGEPGVYISFEERPDEVVKNTISLGFGLDALVADKKLLLEQFIVDPSEIVEAGSYNLDALFLRLGAAIDAIGAKRLVLDSIEALFAGLTDARTLRAELRRMFDWLHDRGVTTIITGERGDGKITRNGLEEYVSDCVILLDQRVNEQIATRRLRIIKYRGSLHGTNEYPFLIDERGFLVLPITTIALDYPAAEEYAPTGIADLDEMLGGRGLFRGSTAKISGTAGTAKTTLAVRFADATCARGERCIYFAFEESPAQIKRNMRSVGVDLDQWTRRGLLLISASRPATFGLEMHIGIMLNQIADFRPSTVVLDPISSFDDAGTRHDAHAMMMRIVDVLKARGITTLFTSLMPTTEVDDYPAAGISSLIDTWILVRNTSFSGKTRRVLSIVKSRGMRHSEQPKELLLSEDGVRLVDLPPGSPAGGA